MKKVTRYQCEHCKKDFKTSDSHDCKYDPKKKNCFTCKHLKGWNESDIGIDVGAGIVYHPNYPDCEIEEDGWDIETIKEVNYNMQCEKWENR